VTDQFTFIHLLL